MKPVTLENAFLLLPTPTAASRPPFLGSFIPGVLFTSVPKVLRCMRLFMLLNLVVMLPALREAISPLLRCLPTLGTLILVSILVIAFWAVMAIHLYADDLHQGCVYSETLPNGTLALLPYGEGPGTTPLDNSPSFGGMVCSISGHGLRGNVCPSPTYDAPSGCTLEGGGCNQTCAAGVPGDPLSGAPEYGEMTLDNFGRAMMLGTMVFTTFWWGKIAGYMMEASTGWAFFIALALVIVGFIVCFNLILVVMAQGERVCSSSLKGWGMEILERLHANHSHTMSPKLQLLTMSRKRQASFIIFAAVQL
jgi:hypothetical protein